MACRDFVSPATLIWQHDGPLPLDSGEVLPGVQVAYRTWGTLSCARDNAVMVCHALTGSADADGWWHGLFGPRGAFDPRNDFIICSNILGSCYGTTGPTSPRPGCGRPWGPDFPAVTVRDMVCLQAHLLDALGIRRLRLVIGGSLGGMQALEWAASFPERVDAIVPIATSGRHSAWCIGLGEAQRAAIASDPRWSEGRYPPEAPPTAGLAAARMIAMCTYRSHDSFSQRFGRKTEGAGRFSIESYLRHQGERLVARFDANSYVTLTRAMDAHDLGRKRVGYESALAEIEVPALVVGITSDVLYPQSEQAELARLMPRARLELLPSPHGHDAFLIETAALSRIVTSFRASLAQCIRRKAS
jgi:homoserine O-acetyltransferase